MYCQLQAYDGHRKRMRSLSLSAALFGSASAVTLAEKNAAIDKVIEMLKEMEARGQKEKQEESVAFAAFNTWCSDTQAEKEADIKESERAIQQLWRGCCRGSAPSAAGAKVHNCSEARSSKWPFAS